MYQDKEQFKIVSSSDGQFRFRFPGDAESQDQDEEWVEVRSNGEGWQRVRMHDYAELFQVPGLYEALVYDVLGCSSPERMVSLLLRVMANRECRPRDLRVLDLGAGNGIVGERLQEAGVAELVGVDILPEAAEAVERDRPGIYEDFIVADLGQPNRRTLERIEAIEPNCLVTVAALGFGDIPPQTFGRAFNLIEDQGWVGLNIKEAFMESEDETGFAALIRRMLGVGVLSLEAKQRIVHRQSLGGNPIFYLDLVGRKQRDLPGELLH